MPPEWRSRKREGKGQSKDSWQVVKAIRDRVLETVSVIIRVNMRRTHLLPDAKGDCKAFSLRTDG